MEFAQAQELRQRPQLQQQLRQNQQATTTVAAAAAETTDTKTRVAEEEAFDSIRQAALVMFKQRTKDLTRLASVERQAQAIDTDLQKSQMYVAQLTDMFAALEARVEVEQQRLVQRVGRLAEVHGALVQVDEEQRAYQRAQAVSEAALEATIAFIARLTDTEGHLSRLMAQAKARVNGRSERDLHAVVAEVEAGLRDASMLQRRLLGYTALAGGARGEEQQADVVAATLASLQTLTAQSIGWGRHAELATVVRLLADNAAIQVRVVGAEGDEADTTTATDALAHITEEDFCTMEEGHVGEWMREHVIATWQGQHQSLHSLLEDCARCHLRVAPDLAASLTELERTSVAEWAELTEQRRQWKADVEASKTAVSAAATAAVKRQAAQLAWTVLSGANLDLSNALALRLKDLEMGMSSELDSCAAARHAAVDTIVAQTATLQALQHAVAARGGETAELRTRQQQEAEAHAEATATQRQRAEVQQALLAETAGQLQAAAAHKAVLEEEVAAVEETERGAELLRASMLQRAQHEKSVDQATEVATAPLASARDNGTDQSATSVLLSELGAPERFMAWGAAAASQKEILVTSDVAGAFVASGDRRDGGDEGDSASSLRVALRQVAADLQLQAEMFTSAVVTEELLSQLRCLSVLRAEEQALRAEEVAHRAFIAEAQTEATLLREELAFTDCRQTS